MQGKPKRICISGKFGSGKDTVASLFLTRTKESFVSHRFSMPIKKIVAILTGTDLSDHMDDTRKHETAPGFEHSHARLHQLVGENFKVLLKDPNVWVKSFMNVLDSDQLSNIVVPDVRFKCEFDALKERGGILIRVNRDGVHRADGRDVEHISETDLDNETRFDYVIQNNGTLAELEDKVRRIMTELGIDYFPPGVEPPKTE